VLEIGKRKPVCARFRRVNSAVSIGALWRCGSSALSRIPVSVVKSFATKRYGGQNETEAVTSFIADLQNSVPGMNNTMEQQSQPVPPDTQMAESEGSMMQPEIDEIDSGMMEA
jgi:hypothetical protein